ncbi:uncharacterized protein LOC116245769 [Nymphaea colorata]|uniref:uncharacterized protein LOC116245769 n=1 Tax=Nymphaea colorata TaxID=210225 RepID=UPI00129D937A|nr:uncharacterized protein LOC116245769 [Nymphaea colorata]
MPMVKFFSNKADLSSSFKKTQVSCEVFFAKCRKGRKIKEREKVFSLEQLPHHMPALKSLMVWACDSLKALVNMPALESLEVSYCNGLEHSHDMPALKSLMVRRCDRLKTLADMPALESLWVEFCDSLEQLPHYMPALESLKVEFCDSQEQLPHDMPALKSLIVCRPISLKALVNIPLLEELLVEYLPNWEGWRAGGSGETTLTSMPRLREANFMNCRKMQTEGLLECQATRVQKLSVWKCPSARLA